MELATIYYHRYLLGPVKRSNCPGWIFKYFSHWLCSLYNFISIKTRNALICFYLSASSSSLLCTSQQCCSEFSPTPNEIHKKCDTEGGFDLIIIAWCFFFTDTCSSIPSSQPIWPIKENWSSSKKLSELPSLSGSLHWEKGSVSFLSVRGDLIKDRVFARPDLGHWAVAPGAASAAAAGDNGEDVTITGDNWGDSGDSELRDDNTGPCRQRKWFNRANLWAILVSKYMCLDTSSSELRSA